MKRETSKMCPSIYQKCFCCKKFGHHGIHECECEGAWDDDKNVYIVPNHLAYIKENNLNS